MVLHGGQGHERVVDRAAGYPKAAEYIWQTCRDLQSEKQWWGKAFVEKTCSVLGCQPKVAGQPGEDGVGLCHSVAAESDHSPLPPVHDGGMRSMSLHQ